MTNPDPFLNAWRDDLADLRLKDQVAAPRYVEGRLAGVTRGVADLRRQPARGAPLDTQLLYGETLRVFDEKIGRAQVCTPVTNAHLVCRLQLEKKETQNIGMSNTHEDSLDGIGQTNKQRCRCHATL